MECGSSAILEAEALAAAERQEDKEEECKRRWWTLAGQPN
jgi:hypothetical protein